MMMFRYAVFGFIVSLYGFARVHLDAAGTSGAWALTVAAIIPPLLVVVWIDEAARKEERSRIDSLRKTTYH